MKEQRNALRNNAWKRYAAMIIVTVLVFLSFGDRMNVQSVYAKEGHVIDANVDDWKDIKDVLEEPEGVFDRIAAYCDKDSFNIIFTVNDVSKWCYFQVYIDTDNNSETGFKTCGGGYEFMVENGTIYKSDSGEWPDTEVGKSTYAISADGAVYEIKVPFDIINASGKTVGFHIGLLNDSWETVYKFPENTTELADTESNVTIVSDEPYISNFKCKQGTVLALTKPAMQDGVIATFSAKGGKGSDYSYSFVSSQKNGKDNELFTIEGNKLITNKKLLAPGSYKVNVKVKSGVRSEIKAFTIKVGNPAPGSITEDIFTGDMGEWFIVDYNKAKDASGNRLMQATTSQNKLFIMVSSNENNMNTQTSFVLDTKKNEGFDYFGCMGADFVIHSQKLYPVIANNRLGAPVVSIKEDYYDNYTTASVYLSDLGERDYIRLRGFVDNRTISLPKSGYLNVKANFVMSYDENCVYPTVDYSAFTNPGTGWVCWSTISEEQADKTAFDYSLAYLPLTWANLETAEGKFDWENVDSEYNVTFWEERGVSFVLRFVIDTPEPLTGDRAEETFAEVVDKSFIKNNNLALGKKVSVEAVDKLLATGNYRMDIPTWLFAKLCEEVLNGKADNAGTFYNWPSPDVLGGAGFSPNYELETVIEYHDLCMKAIAEKFDGKAAYIEMGSLGHWGEMHTWPEAESFEEYDFGSGEFPDSEVIARYGKSYTDAFKLTKVGIRESYDFSRANNFGMFNDVFGQEEGSETFLIDISKSKDFWKENYSGGEFASGDVSLWVHNDRIMQTIKYLRESHTTWLGPCSPCDYEEGSVQASIYGGNIDYLQTKMGYRFRVSKVNEIKEAKAGSTLNLELTFENEGLAPAYQDYDVVVTLVNPKAKSSKRIVKSTTVSAKTTEWLPGTQNIVNTSIKVPSSASGKYLLLVSMTKHEASDALLNLAMANNAEDIVKNGENMYVLYSVDITK